MQTQIGRNAKREGTMVVWVAVTCHVNPAAAFDAVGLNFSQTSVEEWSLGIHLLILCQVPSVITSTENTLVDSVNQESLTYQLPVFESLQTPRREGRTRFLHRHDRILSFVLGLAHALDERIVA